MTMAGNVGGRLRLPRLPLIDNDPAVFRALTIALRGKTTL